MTHGGQHSICDETLARPPSPEMNHLLSFKSTCELTLAQLRVELENRLCDLELSQSLLLIVRV